ncbi:hypothetical protein Tco_0558495 [Tanacetum coccineum]
MGLLATHPDKGISTTKPLPEGTNTEPKDLERLKPLVDRDSSTPPITTLSGTDVEYQVTKDNWEKHKEVAIYYADLRATIEGYHKENVDHRDQTNKIVKETMNYLDKISKERVDERAKLLKTLNRVSETLEVNSALKEAMQKMAESNNTTSGNITSLTELLRNAHLLEILNQLNAFQSTLNTLSSYLKAIKFPSFQERITAIESTRVTMQADISLIEGMVTEMFQAFNGISSKTPSGSAIILIVPQPEVYATVDVQLTKEEIQAHLDKEEKIKQASKEARLSKPELIKFVHEEAAKAGVDPNILTSAKGGQEFRKIQEAEIKVHNKEHYERSRGQENSGRRGLKNTYGPLAANSNLKQSLITPANQRFCLALRRLIGSHPDQEKLKYKKVKLESVRYKLD